MKLTFGFLLIAAIFVLSRHQADAIPVTEEDYVDPAEEEEEEDLGPLPEFTVKGQTFQVRPGDRLLLPCQVDHLGGYTLLWKREEGEILAAGSVLTSRDSRISRDNDSIVISSISASDAGKYICQLASTPPTRQIVHTVQVFLPPSVQPVPSNGVIISHKGNAVTLQCRIEGNPTPVVTWTRHGNKKFSDGKSSEVGSSLTFSAVDRHQAGTYECTADNGEGEPATAEINLIVTYEPIVEIQRIFIGQPLGTYDVEIVCNVHGEPKPEVYWSKNGVALKKSDHYSGSRHVLAIKSIHSQDFANYTCGAENRFGQQQKSIEVTGLAGPVSLIRNKAISHGVELEWQTESLKPITKYRMRYSAPVMAEEVLELPAASAGSQQVGNIYSHVHQLHKLRAETTYELSIQSENAYGWSQPTKFTVVTLSQGEDHHSSHHTELPTGPSKETAEKISSGAAGQKSWIFVATLVLYSTLCL